MEENLHGVDVVIQEWNAGQVQAICQFVNVCLQLSKGLFVLQGHLGLQVVQSAAEDTTGLAPVGDEGNDDEQ